MAQERNGAGIDNKPGVYIHPELKSKKTAKTSSKADALARMGFVPESKAPVADKIQETAPEETKVEKPKKTSSKTKEG